MLKIIINTCQPPYRTPRTVGRGHSSPVGQSARVRLPPRQSAKDTLKRRQCAHVGGRRVTGLDIIPLLLRFAFEQVLTSFVFQQLHEDFPPNGQNPTSKKSQCRQNETLVSSLIFWHVTNRKMIPSRVGKTRLVRCEHRRGTPSPWGRQISRPPAKPTVDMKSFPENREHYELEPMIPKTPRMEANGEGGYGQLLELF